MGAGRPRLFKTAEELEKRIEEYFGSITMTYPVFDSVPDGEDENGKMMFKKVPRLNNLGKQIMTTDFIEHPSVLELARYLGTTRKTLIEYENNPEYSNTIKRAKERIESYLENQLYRRDQVTGIIFNLKNNFGWKDKQEIEQTGEQSINIKFNIPRPSTDEGQNQS